MFQKKENLSKKAISKGWCKESTCTCTLFAGALFVPELGIITVLNVENQRGDKPYQCYAMSLENIT